VLLGFGEKIHVCRVSTPVGSCLFIRNLRQWMNYLCNKSHLKSQNFEKLWSRKISRNFEVANFRETLKSQIFEKLWSRKISRNLFRICLSWRSQEPFLRLQRKRCSRLEHLICKCRRKSIKTLLATRGVVNFYSAGVVTHDRRILSNWWLEVCPPAQNMTNLSSRPENIQK
jgi:hypothetical protein